MKKSLVFIKYFSLSKISRFLIKHNKTTLEWKNISGKKLLSSSEANAVIYDAILSKHPFMVARFGANELSTVRTFDFKIASKYKTSLYFLKTGAGFFSDDLENGEKFKNVIISAIRSIDILGVWFLPFEDYYIKKYAKKELLVTHLFNLEPWAYTKHPWSAALKGKKVLVIHPFEDTIKSQYARREKIFPGTDILPEFELKTLKAVQTIAGEKDERFDTWFDALEWMYDEAMKIEFDVAIIGCGAYGLPLAAKLKKSGKQVIHLGGATQILFGIRGKRWDEDSNQEHIRKFYNEFWVRPSTNETPKNYLNVEDGCYW